jgi:hypothetical protein
MKNIVFNTLANLHRIQALGIVQLISDYGTIVELEDAAAKGLAAFLDPKTTPAFEAKLKTGQATERELSRVCSITNGDPVTLQFSFSAAKEFVAQMRHLNVY